MIIKSPLTDAPWTDPRGIIGFATEACHALAAPYVASYELSYKQRRVLQQVLEAGHKYASLTTLEDGAALSAIYWLAHEARTKVAVLPRIPPKNNAILNVAFGLAGLLQRLTVASPRVDDSELEGNIRAIIWQAEGGGLSREKLCTAEYRWRFWQAAGHLPVDDDDDVFLAFQLACDAGEYEFANHVAVHGWGQVSEERAKVS